MSEAVIHNLDTLVTEDYLDHVLDARFARQDARLDQLFDEVEAHLSDLRVDVRSELRLVHALQTLLIAGVFVPQIKALFG